MDDVRVQGSHGHVLMDNLVLVSSSGLSYPKLISFHPENYKISVIPDNMSITKVTCHLSNKVAI